MQALMSQHIDTSLQAMRQTLEETSKLNTERFTGLDTDLNGLRADL